MILNGRPSTMTAEQLATLLRATPVDRVEKAEVMFSAPPQYHVRGAAINVVLRRGHETAFSGEFPRQLHEPLLRHLRCRRQLRPYVAQVVGRRHLFGGPEQGSCRVSTCGRCTPSRGQQYDIRQDEWMTYEGWSHRLRAAVEYAPKQRGRLSAAYTASFFAEHRRPVPFGGKLRRVALEEV